MKSIKTEKINFIEFNTEKSSRGISSNIPVIQIFDMEKKEEGKNILLYRFLILKKKNLLK